MCVGLEEKWHAAVKKMSLVSTRVQFHRLTAHISTINLFEPLDASKCAFQISSALVPLIEAFDI